jgi:hypothetical protein
MCYGSRNKNFIGSVVVASGQAVLVVASGSAAVVVAAAAAGRTAAYMLMSAFLTISTVPMDRRHITKYTAQYPKASQKDTVPFSGGSRILVQGMPSKKIYI